MNLQTWYRYFVILTIVAEMGLKWLFHGTPANSHKAAIEQMWAWGLLLVIPTLLLIFGLCGDFIDYLDREYKKKTGEDKPHFIQTYDNGAEVVYFKNTVKVYNNARPVLVLSDVELIYLSDLVRKKMATDTGKAFLTDSEKTALQQTLQYCKEQEGKSQMGYFSSGWAGYTLETLLKRS